MFNTWKSTLKFLLCTLIGWKKYYNCGVIGQILSEQTSTALISNSEHDPQAPRGLCTTSTLRQNPPTLDCLSSSSESTHSLQVPFIRAHHGSPAASQVCERTGSRTQPLFFQEQEQGFSLRRSRAIIFPSSSHNLHRNLSTTFPNSASGTPVCVWWD